MKIPSGESREDFYLDIIQQVHGVQGRKKG